MKIQQYHYRNIFWNEGEQEKVCEKLRYYESLGYCDCQIELDEKGNETPRNIDTGNKYSDYCTQIHKVIFPKNW